MRARARVRGLICGNPFAVRRHSCDVFVCKRAARAASLWRRRGKTVQTTCKSISSTRGARRPSSAQPRQAYSST
eukprot:1116453-Pleurochrysis_carterae.AAC.1